MSEGNISTPSWSVGTTLERVAEVVEAGPFMNAEIDWEGMVLPCADKENRVYSSLSSTA